MIEFAWPYVFFLLPLPFIIYYFFLEAKNNIHASLNVRNLDEYGTSENKNPILNTPKIKTLFVFLIWVLLVTAAARPQEIGDAVEIPKSGRDLMLAVDLSGSMHTEDFEINGRYLDRLSALKIIASDFIDRRKGDRLGLILFGSKAYLQTPLTFDVDTVKQLLKEATVGLAGNETAIGDAIALSVKQLRDSPQLSRVLILMTDGNNNTGELSPTKAAELASHENLKIYPVAIGADHLEIQTIFGLKNINPSMELDETTLKMVAEKTGGQYFRAYNTKELVNIYQHIDQLESIERSNEFYRPTDEVYYLPLSLALLCLGLLLGIRQIRWVN